MRHRMKIKHNFSIEDLNYFNDFFRAMLIKTDSEQFKHLSIHQTYISFHYNIEGINSSDNAGMNLPMIIFLVETTSNAKFCLVEQFTNEYFDIRVVDKFSDMNPDLLFVTNQETNHVGICFDSLEELNASIKRILDYTVLLILDDLTFHSSVKH